METTYPPVRFELGVQRFEVDATWLCGEARLGWHVRPDGRGTTPKTARGSVLAVLSSTLADEWAEMGPCENDYADADVARELGVFEIAIASIEALDDSDDLVACLVGFNPSTRLVHVTPCFGREPRASASGWSGT